MDDWPDEPEAIDEAEVEALHQVHLAQRAFSALVPLPEPHASIAALALEAVVRSLDDARAPDDPTPGMMNVAVLAADPLARATLADAAPSAREALGALDRALVQLSAAEREAIGTRIADAVRAANRRIALELGGDRA
ncbi:MAG: hypothetical protein H6531_10740 [Actinobacteria bacterium]|nr:hypothetical protein [Thermoleophilia bacterium]MCB9012292.1 hypothetical protein [Actinomycetota bacterium]